MSPNPAPSPHSFKNRALRVVWGVVQSTLFRWSPRPCHKWRAMLLRMFGADVTMKARIYPKAKIWAPWNLSMDDYATLADDVDCYCVERISIGKKTTVSQYSYLCGATHDFEDERFPLQPMPITLGAYVWVAADCFVAPGVTIPDGAVVGARSGVFTDLESWGVHAGTPAKKLRERNHPLRPEAES
jgi:putative colanic acid biosynthesis acetyltransferase WcaF